MNEQHADIAPEDGIEQEFKTDAAPHDLKQA